MNFINVDYETIQRTIRNNPNLDNELVSRLCEIIEELNDNLQELTEENEKLKGTIMELNQDIKDFVYKLEFIHGEI